MLIGNFSSMSIMRLFLWGTSMSIQFNSFLIQKLKDTCIVDVIKEPVYLIFSFINIFEFLRFLGAKQMVNERCSNSKLVIALA